VALSTSCQLISPGASVCGTISITKTELYFEMDEDDPRNKKIDPKVCSCQPKVNYSVQVMFRYCVKFMVICSDVIEPKQ